MTWNPQLPEGFESDKIAHLVVPYLQGRFLDLGCGRRKVWPSAIGIDDGSAFRDLTAADIRGDVTDLSLFGDETMDGVFSSHVLEDFPPDRVVEVLREWARVLKIGGYLCLYLPSANLYPKCGEEGANPKHRWDIYPGDVEKMLQRAMDGFGWELVESDERGGGDEYSLFVVAKKTKDGWSENLWQRNPEGKKRCLVIRYGAIGDAIMASSVLPALKAQGYHVTVNCKPATRDVLRHDPHIDEWLLQDTDFVPNLSLGAYWMSLEERYDRIVNLCESVETTLLTCPGNLRHAYPDDVRRSLFGGVNYLDRTHEIAGVSDAPRRPRFYLTPAELSAAVKERDKGRPAILWVVNGSADHKIYPHMSVVWAWLLERTPAHIWLTGDANCGKAVQDGATAALEKYGIKDHPRLYGMAGKWSIREALTFARVADCVVGPETGVLNAVSHERNAKVLYLSHSSATNLTRDWVNTVTLEPDRAKAPCFPCHRLHYGAQFCPRDETTKGALCAASIEPEAVFEAIVAALGLVKMAA